MSPTKEQVAVAYARLKGSAEAALKQKETRVLVFTSDILTLLQKAEELSFRLQGLEK